MMPTSRKGKGTKKIIAGPSADTGRARRAASRGGKGSVSDCSAVGEAERSPLEEIRSFTPV